VGGDKAVSYASGLTLQGSAVGNYHLTGSAATAAILGTKTGRGTIQVNNGAALGGSGKVGQVSVNSGGTIAPANSVGTLSTESQTWAGGGTYTWEMADATGTQGGTGWDWINITGGLAITATNHPDDSVKFTLALAGAGLHFDNTATHSWVIATVSDAVTNFNASKFLLSTGGFTPPLGGGSFSVVLQGQSVGLVFTPTPSGGRMVVAWPEALTGWQLQACETLESGWQDVAATPCVVDGRLTVTVTAGGAAPFFRVFRVE
jgi:hypothetical protein